MIGMHKYGPRRIINLNQIVRDLELSLGWNATYAKRVFKAFRTNHSKVRYLSISTLPLDLVL